MPSKKITNEEYYKKHKLWFYIMLTLSILGIIQAAGSVLFGLGDFGLVSYLVLFVLSFISVSLAASLAVAVSMILAFTLLYIIIAIIEYKKMKKYKKEINE